MDNLIKQTLNGPFESMMIHLKMMSLWLFRIVKRLSLVP